MDQLFDTLNSDSADLRRGKPLATNIKESSPHHNFIREMKIFFKDLKFVGCKNTPPSQEGWIWTLNAIELLWKSLTQAHKSLKSLATRRLQQDPLENLFGCIRGNCGSNSNPTTVQFIAGLKTTLLSNLAHIASQKNCEYDDNQAIIDNFKLFLGDDKISQVDENIPIEATSELSLQWESKEPMPEKILEENGEIQACTYVCGFILKKYKNACEKCLKMLTTNDRTAMHTFVQFKEFNDYKESLQYANKTFVDCIEFCSANINDYLKVNAHKNHLKEKICNSLKANANFDFLNDCLMHKEQNINFILNSVFHIVVKRFCTKTNRHFVQDASTLAFKKKINILKHI